MMKQKKKEKKQARQRVIFVQAGSFEPFFQPMRKNINNLREMDHFSTRYIDFMQRHTNKYEFETWILSSTIKKPVSIMHKNGFVIRVFPRDLPLLFPLE